MKIAEDLAMHVAKHRMARHPMRSTERQYQIDKRMKDFLYVEFINGTKLMFRHAVMTHHGELAWAVCEESIECHVLHDAMGRAYDGIHLKEKELMCIDSIVPCYKGKPMPRSSIKFEDLHGLKKILPFQSGCAWGTCKLDDGTVVVFDVLKRVFLAHMVSKDEVIHLNKILPYYNGSILNVYPEFSMSQPQT